MVEATNILVMTVTGKAEDPVSFFPDQDRQPVKLWTALSAEYMGAPLDSYPEPPSGRILLKVLDHPSDGIIRSTLWRLL